MSVWFKRAVLALIVLFVAIQFVRPSRTNPTVNPQEEIQATQAMSPEVQSLLDRSCHDCHSNRTVWPWYSSVAPVSWLVATDVKEGRQAMNLSEWGAYSPKKRSDLLKDVCEEVAKGKMPDKAYTLLHPKARLTSADVQTLCRWTHEAGQILSSRIE